MYGEDYYKVLGVSKDASQDEIKKVYRQLSREYHPDVNKGDKAKEEKFKKISEAYSILGDAKKRKEYDSFRTNPFSGTGSGQRGGGGYGPFEYSTFTGGGGGHTNMEDFSDLFGDLFGMGRKAGQRSNARGPLPKKGNDVHHKLKIDFVDAVKGTNIKLSLPHTGKTNKVNVKIPAGVDEGSKVRLNGKGEPGIAGGADGDLFIEISVKDHEYFERKGDDLYLQVPITIKEAILGCQIEVPTLDGRAKVKIPSGIQGGQKLRLKGKGVPHLKEGGVGDQFVQINITVPKNLNAESKKLIEQFDELNSYDPRKELFKVSS